MTVLLFNLDGEFNRVASRTFAALGIRDILEGDSLNCVGGVYFSQSVLGVEIELERNGWDYFDRYAYTLTVDRDVVGGLHVSSEVIGTIGGIVSQLLADNLGTPIVIDEDSNLRLILPSEKNDKSYD